MTQRRSRRPSSSASHPERTSARQRREFSQSTRERPNQAWSELRTASRLDPAFDNLTRLIERDAPLQTHSGLVLMYGPFQAEMQPEKGQGVASWLRECVRKHGLPSLVRYDYRRRAQVFRRDQFQPWLEPLLSKIPG